MTNKAIAELLGNAFKAAAEFETARTGRSDAFVKGYLLESLHNEAHPHCRNPRCVDIGAGLVAFATLASAESPRADGENLDPGLSSVALSKRR